MSTNTSEVAAFFEELALTLDISTVAPTVERLGREAVQKELLAQLHADALARIPTILRGYLLVTAGVDEMWVQLSAYVCDLNRPREARALIALLLSNHDNDRWIELSEALPDEDATLAVEGYLESKLQMARLGPGGSSPADAREEIAKELEPLPEDILTLLAPQFEPMCQRAGLAPSEIWPFVLVRPTLAPLFSAGLDALAAEASDAAIAALERVRDDAETPELRRQAQAAYLRACSRSIDPDAALPVLAPATAQVSQWAGDGSQIVSVRIERGHGLFDGILLMVENNGLTARGSVVTRQRPEFLDGPLSELLESPSYHFVEAPLPEVTRLLERVLDRKELQLQERRALEFVDHYRAIPVEPLPSPAEDATVENYERLLLQHEAYADWNLLKQAAEITYALRNSESEEGVRLFMSIWFQQLERGCVANGYWHHWKGERRNAALMFRAAEDLARGDTNAPFPMFAILTFRSGLRKAQ